MYNNYAMANLLSLKLQKSKIQPVCNAHMLVDTLVKLGVDSIFGYPGASILSVYNELAQRAEIKHYLVRHEQAAVHAAEGYARSSGKTGVVLVTSGPGFTNTITGIANAYADSTPLVILAGDVTSDSKHQKIFQQVDIIDICESCCKKAYKLTAYDDVTQVIEDAFELANTGKKGPVIIALPRNILEKEFVVPDKNKIPNKVNDYSESLDIETFLKLFESANKPLVLLGGGCIDYSKELEQFINVLNCPVVSTLMGIGIYPSKTEKYLGMIGLNGSTLANLALNKADLVIALGVSFSDRSTCKNINFSKTTKIVNINFQQQVGNFELSIIADIKTFVDSFMQNKSVISYKENWLDKIEIYESEEFFGGNTCSQLHSSFVLKTISEFTKDMEPFIITDVGQHQMLTAQFFDFNKPRKFITSGGLGTMGFGLPAAIGVQIANPDAVVFNITGDGSFQMNLQELATCREHNIPIKVIIMNNSYLGMVRQLQEKIYNSRYQVEMINPDFTKIAEAYDLFAIRVSKKEELIPALSKALLHKGTAIIDIVIDSFENI